MENLTEVKEALKKYDLGVKHSPVTMVWEPLTSFLGDTQTNNVTYVLSAYLDYDGLRRFADRFFDYKSASPLRKLELLAMSADEQLNATHIGLFAEMTTASDLQAEFVKRILCAVYNAPGAPRNSSKGVL